MRPPRNNIIDTLEASFFPPSIESLQSEFEAWQRADNRGTQSLWSMLGTIYELSARVANNDAARLMLIAIVNEDADVRASNKWRAEKRHPQELLLALLLGLNDETKSRKSQWHSALKAALKDNVALTKNSFVAWISDIGGVEAARRSIANRKSNLDIKKLAEQVNYCLGDKIGALRLPEKLSDDNFPEGFGLVLVKQPESGAEAIPVVTITNEGQVKAALRSFLTKKNQDERQTKTEYESKVKRLQNARRQIARKLYREAKSKGRTTAEFEEFLEEWETENLVTPEEWATRITPT